MYADFDTVLYDAGTYIPACADCNELAKIIEAENDHLDRLFVYRTACKRCARLNAGILRIADNGSCAIPAEYRNSKEGE